ncbi:MAG: tRNA lysidine(34) synthetase TilS [Planctomycetota bacterium]|jgi:tRNA(Ile)-lysidine synthetase-like protein
MALSSREPSSAGPSGDRPRRLDREARRHWLVRELEQKLAGRCGVPPGARVVVAVSGGPDSLALLLASVGLRDRRRRGAGSLTDPVAVHVNHHLRDAADEDEAFVTRVCRDLGVPLHTRDVRPDQCRGNLAANARRLRYEALAEVAASVGAGFVAVAHHAQDQLETMLIALGRGGGIDGLSGMAWSRLLADDVQLVRPFLLVPKSSCEAMCAAAGMRWCEDPTNADPATVRGRLRRDVVAVLKELWPSAALGASLAADDAAAARTALQRLLADEFGSPSTRRWDRSRLRALPVPVIAAGLRRAVLAAFPEPPVDIGRAQMLPVAEAIRDRVRRPRTWDWPRGVKVVVTAREVNLNCEC